MADPKGRGKGKGTTVPLTTFLRPEASDWADEDPDNEQGPPLPTSSGGSSRGQSYHHQNFQIDHSEIPNEPPFKAFVGNLNHGIEPSDIGEFFQMHVKVEAVNILRHHDTQKVKGAFVEVASQSDLVKTLEMNGEFLHGRPMRINVATSARRGDFPRNSNERFDDRHGGGFDDRRGGGFGDRPRGYDDRRQGFGARGRDFDRDAFQDRGGPYVDRRGPEPYRSEEDMATTWGHKAFVSSGPKRSPAPTSPVAKPQTSQPQEPPKERKRLVLAPRTVKTEDSEGASASTPQSDKPSKANPFGSAKPVDADAALKKIEEKIAAEKAQSREAEQRQREEIAQQEANSRQAGGNSESPHPKSAPTSLITHGSRGHISQAPQASHRGPPPGASETPPPGIGAPPGMTPSRGGDYGREGNREYGREGDRGRGPPGIGRGRRGRGHEYGRGPSEFRGSEQYSTRNSNNQRHYQQRGDNDFQEAGDRRNQGRGRNFENRPPSGQQAEKGGQNADESGQAATLNKFAALTTDE